MQTGDVNDLKSFRWHFLWIFLLISFNLRVSFSAADPLLGTIMGDLGLGVESSGLFALLPVMALGIAAPLSIRLVNHLSPRYLIAAALALALFGVLWRSTGGLSGLYAGTLCLGLGLGTTGSVITGLVKQVWPQKSSTLMGAYTACVCLGTSLGGASADWLSLELGSWREALLCWAAPLAITLVWWWVHIHRNHPANIRHLTLQCSITPLLREPKAWCISVFYLFRVAGAWLVIVWISTLMRRRGLPAEEAGLVMAVATVSEIPASLATAKIARCIGGTLRLMQLVLPGSAFACLALLLAPLTWWPVFSVLFGVCIGCIFTLGMTLMVEQAADESTTVALSGMAQGVGFIGGGLLAWVCSYPMEWPHPDWWLGGLYTVFALAGLLFGRRSTSGTPLSITAAAPPTVTAPRIPE